MNALFRIFFVFAALFATTASSFAEEKPWWERETYLNVFYENPDYTFRTAATTNLVLVGEPPYLDWTDGIRLVEGKQKLRNGIEMTIRRITAGKWSILLPKGVPSFEFKIVNTAKEFSHGQNYRFSPGFANAFYPSFDSDDLLKKVFVRSRVDSILSREVKIFYPPGYEKGKAYRVLLMNDGDKSFLNVRDEKSWGIHETATAMVNSKEIEPVIVVAIPPGMTPDGFNLRAWEYTHVADRSVPDFMGKTGGGTPYVEFIVNDVLPALANEGILIKENGLDIAGSSLGGLISIWAAILHPEKFTNIGSLSTAFQIGMPHHYDDGIGRDLFSYIEKNNVRFDGKTFFIYAGDGVEFSDWDDNVEMSRRFFDLLKSRGAKLFYMEESNVYHNEPAWRRVMPNFFRSNYITRGELLFVDEFKKCAYYSSKVDHWLQKYLEKLPSYIPPVR